MASKLNNSRTATSSKTINLLVIVSVLLTSSAVANGASCSKPDIQLTVKCGNGTAQLQWITSGPPPIIEIGYCVRYECNSNASVDYCRELKGIEDCNDPLKKRKIIESSSFDNSTCWFWVKDQLKWNYPDKGYSALVKCNEDNEVSSVTSVLPPSVTSDFILPSASPVSFTFPLPPASLSLSLTSVSLPSLSVSSLTSSSVSLTSSSVSLTSSSSPILQSPSSTSSLPSLSPTASMHAQRSNSPNLYSALLYITLCCIVIFVVLLSIISICLLIYWRKRKRQQFESFVKNQIDVCCEHNGELAKESDSEIETVINDDDIASIREDDMYVMLRKILHPDETSLDLSIFSDNDADDGSVALSHYKVDDGSVDCSHYCGSAHSAGQCSQSNTSIN